MGIEQHPVWGKGTMAACRIVVAQPDLLRNDWYGYRVLVILCRQLVGTQENVHTEDVGLSTDFLQ